MPNRILKPGIISSPKWDSLPWISQSFYIRLLTLVDDYGRYEASPVLLRNHAFPLREDIRTSQVLDLCEELATAQLVNFYKADGKEYLQFTNWTNKPRADASKYPELDSECEQMFADEIICKQLQANDPLTVTEPLPKPEPKPLVGHRFEEFWQAYPKKVGKEACLKAWKKLNPSDVLAEKMLFTLAWQTTSKDWTKEDGKFVPNPSTWLNQGRWDDEPSKPSKPPISHPGVNGNGSGVAINSIHQADSVIKDCEKAIQEIMTDRVKRPYHNATSTGPAGYRLTENASIEIKFLREKINNVRKLKRGLTICDR